jgi:uncharacterized protein (DUF433 family)
MKKVTKNRSDDLQFPNITYRLGAAGRFIPVIRGTGIRVQTLVISHQSWGETESFIARQYNLDKDVVRDALVFYEIHREEIDTLIEEDQLLK